MRITEILAVTAKEWNLSAPDVGRYYLGVRCYDNDFAPIGADRIDRLPDIVKTEGRTG